MLGTELQFGGIKGEDRFYIPARVRKNYHQQRLSRRPSKIDKTESPSSDMKSKFVGSKPLIPQPKSNLDRFLDATTPSVPAQYSYKTNMRGWRPFDTEFPPYFVLNDLWESFKEWSAYGAGVPIVLNGGDSVVQYYVPYLSAIQIYGESPMHSKSRLANEDIDNDSARDTSSDDHSTIHESFSSDDGDAGNPRNALLFQFLEQDLPYQRVPLTDKIFDLAYKFPGLKTLKSCDILPASWISVAWYPIYRIPTGPTLKDLDACFLTYHSLSTPIRGNGHGQAPVMIYPNDIDGIPKVSLPVFGMATYKLKGSIWAQNSVSEHQMANSLMQAADNWLRLLHVKQPDFQFFASHGTYWR